MTDWGGELTDDKIRKVVDTHGYTAISTTAHGSRENGMVEWPHRTLKERIRCILYAARFVWWVCEDFLGSDIIFLPLVLLLIMRAFSRFLLLLIALRCLTGCIFVGGTNSITLWFSTIRYWQLYLFLLNWWLRLFLLEREWLILVLITSTSSSSSSLTSIIIPWWWWWWWWWCNWRCSSSITICLSRVSRGRNFVGYFYCFYYFDDWQISVWLLLVTETFLMPSIKQLTNRHSWSPSIKLPKVAHTVLNSVLVTNHSLWCVTDLFS